ncbi:hypothetical protein L1887_38732 [Cichorium endivia]|nr:hypothetical protein L1887_38732 [Cichorium endivia]
MLVSATIHNFVASRLLSFSALSLHGDLIYASKLVNSVQQPNMFMWNTLIRGLASSRDPCEALLGSSWVCQRSTSLLQELEKHHVVPNDRTFIGVLSACCHAGMLDFGRKLFKVFEAGELIKGMPWKADLNILGALLSACGNHGNIKVAERVVKEMIVLEPDNHGVYVVLSNVYADVGRWEDVSKVRDIMKDVLKKILGWSHGDD